MHEEVESGYGEVINNFHHNLTLQVPILSWPKLARAGVYVAPFRGDVGPLVCHCTTSIIFHPVCLSICYLLRSYRDLSLGLHIYTLSHQHHLACLGIN